MLTSEFLRIVNFYKTIFLKITDKAKKMIANVSVTILKQKKLIAWNIIIWYLTGVKKRCKQTLKFSIFNMHFHIDSCDNITWLFLRVPKKLIWIKLSTFCSFSLDNYLNILTVISQPPNSTTGGEITSVICVGGVKTRHSWARQGLCWPSDVRAHDSWLTKLLQSNWG